jgi:hypothetical protein
VAEKTWLTSEQAVELIRERYNVSTGKAEAVVRDAFKSDEVRNTLVNDDEALRLLGFDGMAIPPPSLNKADFVDWLDRNPPGKRAAAPKKATPTRSFSVRQIANMVVEYKESLNGAQPSIEGLENFVRSKHGLKGHRAELRSFYRDEFPDRRPGRPLK